MTTAYPSPPTSAADLRDLLEANDHDLTIAEWAAFLADKYPLEYGRYDRYDDKPGLLIDPPPPDAPCIAANQAALVEVYRKRANARHGKPDAHSLYHPDDYCQREECLHRGLLANGRNGIARETGVLS